MPFGELRDMIACERIAHGEKEKPVFVDRDNHVLNDEDVIPDLK